MHKNVEMIRRAARGIGVKYLRVEISLLARDAGVSESLARRFVQGEHVGALSADRLRLALGVKDGRKA